MMHEIDDSLEFQGRSKKSYYGLVGWNAFHVFVATVAGLVALSTPNWIDTEPQGLLGIDNAGLWQVCYTDVPEDETVDNLTRHLGDIVAKNLFGTEGASEAFNLRLEEELLDSDKGGAFQLKLKELLDSPSSAVNKLDNTTTTSEEESFDDLADGPTPDAIPQSVRDTTAYSSALQEATVNVIVEAATEDFPVSSGCTDPMRLTHEDPTGEFFDAVPYPNGPTSYYLFQCMRGFVAGFCLFGAITCIIFLATFAIGVGTCSSVNMGLVTCFAVLHVACGLAGVIAYFILLARISSSDSKQILNVSYMFVEDQIQYGLAQYWGWSGWVFIGATGWSVLFLPFLCGTISQHTRAANEDPDYGPVMEDTEAQDTKGAAAPEPGEESSMIST